MRLRIRSISCALLLGGAVFAYSGLQAQAAEDRRVSVPTVTIGPASATVPAFERMQIAFGSIPARPLERFGLPFAGRPAQAKTGIWRFMRSARDGQMAFAGSTRGYGGFYVQTVVRWHVGIGDK